ncbi:MULTISPECIES: HEPN domain-containing protein [unclassified Dehalobacter]|uniref:HEPN domain-containing protein n=1 Tax=unclassified Dehalobacter TaxID=2635733 RepID=UPI000E6CF4FA|nr:MULTISPECIES: HEPN domain-containing protein [unclassified Dehalobacter]RJE48913.1 hypothetical protein A7K50_09225 [Dehalobacter sp. MCB1]TCX52077.1 hypothetical protein C1I36_07110 [Dehalobacter sp. 14DCB1]TCX53150.1 hypothetical protein C1I38_08875 [Dehalobacter sp. 12DCB1]
MGNRRGFIFIGDILEVNIDSEFEIIPGHLLKKANSNQIETIKMSIPETDNTFGFTKRYELDKKEESNGSGSYIGLEESDWKYWIIEYDGNQVDDNIDLSLLLSKADIHVLFQIIPSGGRMYSIQGLHNYLSDNTMLLHKKIITKENLIEVRELTYLIENFIEIRKDIYSYIYKSLADFRSLKQIPRKSSFMIVAIFSILETLLVHNPQKGDSSITHQLKTKLNLLNNRFDEKIDFRLFFGGPDSNTFELIIEKLYSYRSDIAHGDFSNFNKELSAIVGKERAIDFLYFLLKKVIIHALKEPQLISDLKIC